MKYITLFFAVVLMVFGCSSTVKTRTLNEQNTKTIKCDTTYYRGVDEETGDYYLIIDVTCDTIPSYEYVPGKTI
jgi:uncharacterized protein YceK